MVWTEDGAITRESYVNLIPTPAGGTHEAGLRDGLFNAVRAFVDAHGLLPKGVKLLPEDVFARASFVLSAKVLDPQFQGQIKERLNSRDALRLVSSFVRPQLEFWLNQHPNEGRQLAELVIRAGAGTRQRAGQKVEKKQGLGRRGAARQADRLRVDATSTRNELFLVEGDSAGGCAKMGARQGDSRRSCRLRGKVLNTWEVATACSEMPKCTTSRWRSVSTRTARGHDLSKDCATARSASWPTPTSTARTSRCCC